MPVRGVFEIKGLDKYLEDLAAAEKDVDQVVSDVLTEAAPIAEKTMRDELHKTSETWTGAAAATLFSSSVQRDGNYIFIELGANTGKDPAALYKEYGTARQAAEPFLRISFRWLRKNKLKAMMKEVMERFGLPT
jgi:phage protein, HK97 gp10 family